ncbi:MAG TPA: ABC transporter permease [Anaerolineae bacterium]|nr:ABC transporter permease [Anaerolineae bacterium]
MVQYTVRRILLAIPVMFAIVLVVFLLARAIPGSPCRAILGEKATVEACERFDQRFGLDRPVPVQLAIYVGNIVKGDFGDSIRFGRPITQMLAERLPLTVELGVSAMFLAVLIGIPAGAISALRRNSPADVATMVGANVGVSIPVFVLGLYLIYIFAVVLKGTPFALPPSGRLSPGIRPIPFYTVYNLVADGEKAGLFTQFIANHYMFNALITGDFTLLWDAMKHMILPALALSTIPLSIIARMTRSSMLEVLELDYILTAKSKGLPERIVMVRHALRSALLPIVTIIGLQAAAILGGAILTETIFGLTGIGKSLFEAITSRDFPVIQGFTIIIAAIYVVFNLIVDLSYAYFDPRIRLE